MKVRECGNEKKKKPFSLLLICMNGLSVLFSLHYFHERLHSPNFHFIRGLNLTLSIGTLNALTRGNGFNNVSKIFLERNFLSTMLRVGVILGTSNQTSVCFLL